MVVKNAALCLGEFKDVAASENTIRFNGLRDDSNPAFGNWGLQVGDILGHSLLSA